MMKKTLTISTILAASCVSTLAFAEDISTLNRITVVATKSEQRSFDVPAMVDVVDVQERKELTLASTLDDVLAESAAIDFNGSPRRNGQSILMRGFDKDSILVTVDGVRQNFSSAHDGNYFIDPSLLKSVEVVRGANSPLYGSGGLGGVVRLQTVDALDLLRDGQDYGAQISVGYESVNEEFSTSASGYGATDTVDALVNITYRNSNDIELGDGTDLLADDALLSGMVKVNFTPAEGHDISAQYVRFQNDSVEPNNPQQYTSDQIVDKEIESQTFKLHYAYDGGSAWLNPEATVFYTDSSVRETELTSNGLDAAGTIKSRDVDTIGLALSNRSEFATGDIDHQLQYGVEYYKDEQNGKNSADPTDLNAGVPDAESEFFSAYIQDEIALAIGEGELLIVPGLRFDDYSSKDALGNKQSESEISPKIAATYKPNEHFMFFASYAEAFRAPNVTELYPSGTHFSIANFANTFLANPNLRPEKGKTFEIGAGANFTDIAVPGDEFLIKGSYYNTRADDFIDSEVVDMTLFNPFAGCPFPNPFNPACSAGNTQSVNVGRAKIDGFELELGYENTYLRATASYSYMDGKDRDTGEYIQNLIPQTFNTSLVGKLPQWDAEIGWKASYVDGHKKVNDSLAERKGYAVHGVFANWQPTDQIGISMGVDNVFDKEYARVFAESLEAGRNYKVKATFRW